MTTINNNIETLYTSVLGIIGNKAWGVKIGQGSFLTIEFGESLTGKADQTAHGEWHLWAYLCSWRVEKKGQFIAGSGDPKDIMEESVKNIEGCRLEAFQIMPQTLDATLVFDKGMILKLFSVLSENETNEESPHWLLYIPTNKIITAGPGSKWVIEDDN